MPHDALQQAWPDEAGQFGDFGGRVVPASHLPVLEQIEATWLRLRADNAFWTDLLDQLGKFAGRPTPLHDAGRLAERAGQHAHLLLKREDLLPSGTTSMTVCLGQAKVAQALGRKRVVCDTGSGLHGVAAATACARLDLDCHVYMGAHDVALHTLHLGAIEALGGHLHVVDEGSRTLVDATTAAIHDVASNPDDTFYMARAAMGPHPYPLMLRDLSAIVGAETRRQLGGRAVAAVVAASIDAVGMFYAFLGDERVRLVVAEAGGVDPEADGHHSAPLTLGTPGELHGMKTRILQNKEGVPTHGQTIAPGLRYPGAAPELAWLAQMGRIESDAVPDEQAAAAFHLLARSEGILASFESSHAVAAALRLAATLDDDSTVIVCVGSRGEKDLSRLHEYPAPLMDEGDSR